MTDTTNRACLTQDAVYHTTVEPHCAAIKADTPGHIDLCAPDVLSYLHGTIEERLHDAMEWALAPYFIHAMHQRRVFLIQLAGYGGRPRTPEEDAELASMTKFIEDRSGWTERPLYDNLIRRLRRLTEEKIILDVTEATTLRVELAAARARIAVLEKALELAADAHTVSAEQFAFYAEQHKAKTPPDTAKAITNIEHMNRCMRASLAARSH
jgi:hypothetical protein